jgi:hypothetical protein
VIFSNTDLREKIKNIKCPLWFYWIF